jgi:hypothetical protein
VPLDRRTRAARRIANARVRTQRLSPAATTSPADVVRWLGAVQSQDYPLAVWSVGQRLRDGTARHVHAAIVDGSILRTHVLRPTWHFVARDDLRWMLAVTAPQVLARMRLYDRHHGVDAALIAASRKAITDAIRKSGHLTRAEIAAALKRARLKADSGWLVGHLLMHAELAGAICSGAPRGGQQTYALVEERAPKPQSLDGDAALAELATRYFQSHSPASVADFRWWSGLSAAQAARAVAAVDGRVHRLEVDGRTLLVHAGSEAADEPAQASGAHLLQAFDELSVAYSETRDLIDVAGLLRHRKPEGLLTRMLLLNGQAIGRWRRVAWGTTSAVSVSLATRVSAAERRAVLQGVARFGAFLEQPVAVEIVDLEPAGSGRRAAKTQ